LQKVLFPFPSPGQFDPGFSSTLLLGEMVADMVKPRIDGVNTMFVLPYNLIAETTPKMSLEVRRDVKMWGIILNIPGRTMRMDITHM
jgi:hypothetical protein